MCHLFSFSVIPRVTRHLLSNPVFSCITLAACMEIAVVAGFAAFLGKYLEQQFNLTTSSANQLLGRQVIILNESVKIKMSLKWKWTTFPYSIILYCCCCNQFLVCFLAASLVFPPIGAWFLVSVRLQ